MPAKFRTNGVMLWSMAISITVSLMVMRQLQAEGLHPIHAALFQALGCALTLAIVERPALGPLLRQKDALVYFAVASVVGFTVPRLVVAVAVSHTGVGLTTLAFTLPLVVTYAIALAFRVESFDRWRLAFLLLTVAGAVIFVSTRMQAMAVEGPWFALLMLAPLALGYANVYRSTAWPGDLRPTTVAFATALFSLLSYVGIAGLTGVHTDTALLARPENVALLGLFMGAAGFEQALVFQLQRKAGPVYIGQAGALVVLFGGAAGALVFGERYSTVTLAGSLLIITGVISYCRLTARKLDRSAP
jgi:drug/metabolite transporter (DMT)-like permease